MKEMPLNVQKIFIAEQRRGATLWQPSKLVVNKKLRTEIERDLSLRGEPPL